MVLWWSSEKIKADFQCRTKKVTVDEDKEKIWSNLNYYLWKYRCFNFFFLILDYEASISEKSETPESISEPPETESESPEPKSVSSENLTNISPSLSSEEQIIEPTKTSTILISEPISEPIMEDTLSKEEEREVSTHNSEKLVEEDPVAEPDVESVVESGKIKLLQGVL